MIANQYFGVSQTDFGNTDGDISGQIARDARGCASWLKKKDSACSTANRPAA
jgi:hypothetical protein